MPKNSEIQTKSSFTTCRVRLWDPVISVKRGHMETRRFDQKTLEKAGSGRKNGENGRSGGQRRKGGEQERREGWEAQRAVGLLHDIANTVGIMCIISRPPLHEKRPCSNRSGKKQKMVAKKNAHLSRAPTGPSPQMLQLPTEMAPPQVQKATDAHHCPKTQQKCHKTPPPLSETQRKYHEPQQTR